MLDIQSPWRLQRVTWTGHGTALQPDSRVLSAAVQVAVRLGNVLGTAQCESVDPLTPKGSSGWPPARPRLLVWSGDLWAVGWLDAGWSMASVGIKKSMAMLLGLSCPSGTEVLTSHLLGSPIPASLRSCSWIRLSRRCPRHIAPYSTCLGEVHSKQRIHVIPH